MEIVIQSSDELEQLRERLRKMSDPQLVSFGKAARSLCQDPRCPDTFQAATRGSQNRVEAQAPDQKQKWPDLICSKKQKGDCRATFHSNLPLRSFAPLAFAVFPKLYQSRFLCRTTSEIRCKEQKREDSM